MTGNQTVAEFLAELCAVETWRQIGEWPYEVSSWGRVRRIGGDVLAQSASHGYWHVSISTDGVKRSVRVHKLVAEAFWGSPPFEDAQAAHNDGDQNNNRADNLRWTTGADNQADRRRHNTKIVGSDVDGSKLSEADIPIIRRRTDVGENYRDIARDYGVSVSTISLIGLRKTWKHVPESEVKEV